MSEVAAEIIRRMRWKRERPTEPGFYYWQNEELTSRWGHLAVRVVQVSKYKNRDGFHCATLTNSMDGLPSPPFFGCDLGQEPPGKWAGPLPQPF